MKQLKWFLFLLPGCLAAATINVNPGSSIQSAINGAASGDTIVVASGNYSGDINVNKSGLTVKGTSFPKITGFINVSAPNCTVDGFASGNSSVPNNKPFVVLNSDHGTVSNCKVEHVTNSNTWDDATGFQCNGSYNTITHCLVRDTSDMDAYRLFGDHQTLSWSECYDKKNPNYGAGAHADVFQSWGGLSNCLIENNWFDPGPGQFSIIDTNPGGNSNNCHDVIYRNNVQIGGDQSFWFIKGIKMYNNIWYRSAKGIGDLLFLDQNAYSGYEIRNNVFYDTGNNSGNGFISGGSPITGNLICSNNYFSYNGNGQVSHNVGTNAVNGGDPKFVNPGSDFHTSTGSVLIGKGVAISPPFPDRDGSLPGSSWDIGPYQKAGAPPVPSTKFKQGDLVSTLSEVNVRSAPAGSLAGIQPANSTATVVASPATPAQFNGGLVQWWQLTFTTAPNGWVGEDNLALASATPTPNPSATPTPSPTVPPSPTPSPSPGSNYSNWWNELGKFIQQHPATPNP